MPRDVRYPAFPTTFVFFLSPVNFTGSPSGEALAKTPSMQGKPGQASSCVCSPRLHCGRRQHPWRHFMSGVVTLAPCLWDRVMLWRARACSQQSGLGTSGTRAGLFGSRARYHGQRSPPAVSPESSPSHREGTPGDDLSENNLVSLPSFHSSSPGSTPNSSSSYHVHSSRIALSVNLPGWHFTDWETLSACAISTPEPFRFLSGPHMQIAGDAPRGLRWSLATMARASPFPAWRSACPHSEQQREREQPWRALRLCDLASRKECNNLNRGLRL